MLAEEGNPVCKERVDVKLKLGGQEGCADEWRTKPPFFKEKYSGLLHWNWLEKETGEGEEIIWTRTQCKVGGPVNIASTEEEHVRGWYRGILGLK